MKARKTEPSRFQPGQRVRVEHCGLGTYVQYEPDTDCHIVAFDDYDGEEMSAAIGQVSEL
jgi:hypothetical protein